MTDKEMYCKKCGGTGCIEEIDYYEDDTGRCLEREIASRCPECNPDMRAYGDKESDWR
mgnify:CR=1 FL=1